MFKNLYYGWWIVFACFIINLYVSAITFFDFTAFFEPIQHEFGWSYTQISLAASLRGLEMGIFAPVVGFFVDRFGARKLLLGGTIIVGIGMVLMSFTSSLPMFYLAILFISLGKMLGIVLWTGSMGGIIGPTLAGWVFDAAGSYTLAWYGFGAVCGFAVFLTMRIKPTAGRT